jgi:hypothetical protein
VTCIRRRNIFHLLPFSSPAVAFVLWAMNEVFSFLEHEGKVHLLCFGRGSAPTSPFLYGSPLPLEASGTSLIEQVEHYAQQLIGTTTLSARLHFTLLIVCRPPDWLPMASWSPPRSPSLFSRRQPSSFIRGPGDVQPEKNTRGNTVTCQNAFGSCCWPKYPVLREGFFSWPAAGRLCTVRYKQRDDGSNTENWIVLFQTSR